MEKTLYPIKIMRVTNMRTAGWNLAKQQYIINHWVYTYFQSYDSIIVFRDNLTWKIILWKDWNYSKTTWKYRNIFLWETLKETKKKIEKWIYIIDETL